MGRRVMPDPPVSSATPFHIMAKPIGPICNLDCAYCFYLEKEKLYPETRQFRMDDEALARFVCQYIDANPGPEVTFAWQGGEPTLMGLPFFERMVALQREHATAGKRIVNALQTNGTLLDEEWCEFLGRHDFLVGLSVDGPRELHDRYRVDKRGRPTFDQVMAGLDLLRRHNVEFNTLTVVHAQNAKEPSEVYRFLREHGSGYIQFIPLVERRGLDGGLLALAPPPDEDGDAEPPVTPWSVGAEDYGRFLSAVFDEWVCEDVGRVFVQSFDVALGLWMGLPSSACYFAETCGRALAIEHNGDLYACDHYVYPEYRRGNIADTDMASLVDSSAQEKFGDDKRDTLPKYCRECDVRFACNGECPKHRFITTPDGEPGLNYLCAGYKRFFRHIDPYMRTMAELLRSGRPAADIMPMACERDAQQTEAARWHAVGRNDPCPCGSGKKHKRCCGARAREGRA